MYFANKPQEWSRRKREKERRLSQLVRGRHLGTGIEISAEHLLESLQMRIVSGDRVVLEGDNQKQADFLSHTLQEADPGKLHDIHLLISSVSRAEHLNLFERDIARKIDFAFAGPQSLRMAQLLEDGKQHVMGRPGCYRAGCWLRLSAAVEAYACARRCRHARHTPQ